MGRVRDARELSLLSLLRQWHVGVVLRVLFGVDWRLRAVREHELPGLLAAERLRYDYAAPATAVGLGRAPKAC